MKSINIDLIHQISPRNGAEVSTVDLSTHPSFVTNLSWIRWGLGLPLSSSNMESVTHGLELHLWASKCSEADRSIRSNENCMASSNLHDKSESSTAQDTGIVPADGKPMAY